jgi:hypothetical protein
MDTPAHRAMPKSPNCQTTRLLANAPRQPAEKQIIIFFIKTSNYCRFHSTTPMLPSKGKKDARVPVPIWMLWLKYLLSQ